MANHPSSPLNKLLLVPETLSVCHTLWYHILQL